MKKIWQKSLASMVSAALCLTAFVGCLTVNAATTYEGTITSKGVEVSETAESATVTLNISSPEAAMNIAAIAATTDFGTLTDVAVEGENCKIDENKNLAEGRFYVDAIDNAAGFNTAAVILTFTKAEKVGVGNHPVTITYFAKESAATWNEDIVNLTVNGDINITVKASTPVCDHANLTVVSATPATETTEGSIVFTCDDCGEQVVKSVYYSKYSRAMFTSVSAESEILFCMGVRDTADLNRVGTANGWSDLYFQFVQERVDGSSNLTKIINYLKAEDTTMSSTDVYKFSYGVASTNLGDVITGYAYTYNSIDDKWYSGQSLQSGVAQYALKMLATSTDLQRTMLVDLLNYGAAAQINFGYDTNNLVNSSFVYNGVDYSSYATTGSADVIDQKSMASSSTQEYPVTYSTFGIECESKLIFNVAFQFGSKYYSDYVADYDGLYVVVDYTDFTGAKKSVTYYNSSVSDSDHTFSLTDGVRKFALQFNDFTAADMRTPLTVNVYKADGTKLTVDSTYSVQSYVYTARNSSNSSAELLTLANEMIQYGDACNAFLASK